jgi:hypothetical protein
MTENDPQLPDDIRKALKKSQTYSPPESFYRGVLEKIERQRSSVPWYFGYPMKGLATACVLVMIVLVTRETRRSKPELFRNAEMADKIAAVKSDASPAPASFAEPKAERRAILMNTEKTVANTGDMGEDLAKSKDVQGRLDVSISGLVGNPSPFEEEDAKLRGQLQGNENKPEPARKKAGLAMGPAPAPAPTTVASIPVPYVEQARDTVSGVATQASFAAQQVYGSRQNLKSPISPQEWKGTVSSLGAYQTVVVRTAEDWQKLWLAHTSYIVPPPPAPEVNFETMMVVGIFDGAKPTAGYFVDIVGVQNTPDKVIVNYRETSPPAGQPIAQVATQPFLLRVVAKTSLPVIFQKVP